MSGGGEPVSRETENRFERFAELLRIENQRHNLISPSTVVDLRKRHIADCAQLARFLPKRAQVVDVGSGGGFPGMVLALMGYEVTMVEPRRLRAEFLRQAVEALGLASKVVQTRIERVAGKFDAITARAVAPLDRLLGMTLHLAHTETLWILPKGRSAKSELEQASRNWQCDVEQAASGTDPDSTIFLIRNVKAKLRP